MTAISYMRRSSNARAGALDVSFDAQRAAIEALAQRHNDTIDTEYSDTAKSGGSTTGRTGYKDMLAAIEADSINVVYAYALTRLTRSLGDLMDLTRLAEANGVLIRTAQDGIDTSTSSGRGVMKLIGVVAEMEREWAQERVRSAIAQRKAKGHQLGSAGYGQRLRGGKPEKDSDEDVAAVMTAFGESDRNFSQTARLLNDRGVRPRWSDRWSARSVSNIVRRELGEASVPKTPGGPIPKRTHLLSGLLHCGHCGGLMTGKVTTAKGKDYISMLCGAARYLSSEQHPRPFIHAQSRLIPLVRAEADHLSIPFDVLEDIEDDDGQRATIESQMARTRDMYKMGDLDRDEYIAERDKLQNDLDRLQARAHRRDIPPTIDWNDSPERINAVLQALFERIDLTPDGKSVASFTWRVPEWRAA